MKPGDLVFETLDGGAMPARVIAQIEASDQVLVRLEPNALGWRQGKFRNCDREQFRDRGYVVFHAASLSTYT